MSMQFGFSYVGLLFLLLLFIPNLFWTKRKPQDYEKYVGQESRILRFLERTGEVLVTGSALIFSDFNLRPFSPWTVWLILAALLMALYELYWIRYFRSSRTLRDFYCSLLGVPVAGATLPVLAFLLLAVYGRNPVLFISAALLGVGHIGIHLQHRKEISP